MLAWCFLFFTFMLYNLLEIICNVRILLLIWDVVGQETEYLWAVLRLTAATSLYRVLGEGG